jgi:hypothetical protein
MPRVFPSQVVGIIDEHFTDARTEADFAIRSRSSGILKAILRLIGEIPTELLELNPSDYGEFVCAVESLSSAVTQWEQQRGSDDPPAQVKKRNPIVIIREALGKCPDESPAPGTVELLFINHAKLAHSIRTDISAANRDALNGEWKGATVLAGAATEAMLLWAIEEAERKSPGSVASASAIVLSANEASKGRLDWGLSSLTKVAKQLRLIEADTAKKVDSCREFRNLIHPGRALRERLVCDRGTALIALATVEFVVRDLKKP